MSRDKAGFLKRTRKKFRLFLSMPTGLASVVLIIIAVGMLFASAFFKTEKCSWLSNALVSCACGLITGFVLFVLTNLRAKKSIEIRTEYERMKAVFDCIRLRKGEAALLLKHPVLFESVEDNWEYIDRISTSLDEIDDLIAELPEHVYFDILDYENNYPVPYEIAKQIETISASIEDFDDEARVKELCSVLLPVYDDLIKWLTPAKDSIYDKYKELCRQII